MDSNGSKANNLTIEGLDAAYGAVRVIEGVSLNVRSGETVALLGTNGNGKSTLMKCVMGIVPPIAGRSPSYMVRQMWDMQQGTRNGASAQLMKLVVANLTEEDMVAIAAYVTSRLPPGASGHTKRVVSTD